MIKSHRNTPLLYRIDLRPQRLHTPSSPPGPRLEAAAEQALLCAACSAAITDEKQAIEVGGSHHHTFFNPAGIVFELRCFQQAAGAIAQGDLSTEFTWFAGFQWQVALCSSCKTHLGWHFTSAQSFYGLIKDRLI